jgi:polyphosphate:AMP phosphotransferase
MFQVAELGRKVSKREYKERSEVLRQELLYLQRRLQEEGDFQVIVDFAGVDGAGKGASIQKLASWMDPRYLIAHAWGPASDEERERPEFWRFWMQLPPRAQIGLFARGRYSRPFLQRAYGKISEFEYDAELDRVLGFENDLAEDGALIIKFWMHLSRDAQERRLTELQSDPVTSWQVKDIDWEHWRIYDQFVAAAERTITRTSTGKAPWILVEGEDENFRSLEVGQTLARYLREHLIANGVKLNGENETLQASQPETDTLPPRPEGLVTVLSQLDMSKRLSKIDYKKKMRKYQGELHLLQRKAMKKGVSSIIVFEGMDAAGKGGAIRRTVAPLDPRIYRIVPIAAPTDEERAQHYLWRFWRHMSRAGHITIYDRSWYGRVLVERIEGFASRDEWQRAYAEINDFEKRLADHGIVLTKFWVHITPEEQFERFSARAQSPLKRWKLTDEDWRNRQKWYDYEQAAHDMIARTDTLDAPWVLIEGNDKQYARTKVIKTLCQRLSGRLD